MASLKIGKTIFYNITSEPVPVLVGITNSITIMHGKDAMERSLTAGFV